MPRVIARMDLRGFDIILSSSHAVAKGVIPPPHAIHICFCHTPMRYAWEMEDEYLRDFGVPPFLRRTVKRLLKRMRRWDLTTAKRVDVFIANSTSTQERIARIYGRESLVIPPPVDERFFVPPPPKEERTYYLSIGRLVPDKRFDLTIAAANALSLPLKIAGVGRMESSLRRLAGPTVEFLGFVPDEELPALYAGAKAVIFPQVEDAGVVPLEAQASGTPVIALKKGGVLDSVQDNVTGLFFEEQTTQTICDAIVRFEHLTLDHEAIRSHARAFSSERFRDTIQSLIEETFHRSGR
jgi:glycosyltransferase involved in cell wall biosynthesis